MPEDAFKTFRAHVSRYPGCDVKNVAGSYRLFLTGRFEFFYYGSAFFKGKPRSLQFNPIYEQIDDTKITSSP